MRVIVTAGGTSEPVDDVRVLTNVSSGRFGAACANALAERGCDVTLIASAHLAGHREWIDPRVRVVPFRTFADLDQALAREIAAPPDALLMAAAVSDYSPVAAPGKIRSDADTLTLTLTRNPKLLASLRTRCGPGTVLVGFKLLSGVATAELVGTARRYVDTFGLDLVLANDLRELSGGRHPAWIVGARGEPEGTTAETAARLVDVVLAARSEPAATPGELEAVAAGGEVHRPGTSAPAPARLLERTPGLGAVLVLPDAVALPTAPAPVPWTGDARDEGYVTAALGRAAWAGRWRGGGFAVPLAGAGSLVGISRASVASVPARWAATVEMWRGSLAAVGIPDGSEPRPAFDGDTVVGVVARHDTEHGPAFAVWLRPDARGEGRGDRVLQELSSQGRQAWVHDRCGLGGWFADRGWLDVGRDGAATVLSPPSRRQDLAPAASVCLVDPLRRRVLLGRRLVAPAQGQWAFPGGRTRDHETPVQAALRELHEETGIALDGAVPVASREVPVGGRPGFLVTSLVIPVLHAPEPRTGPELDACWVGLDEARGLRPMTAGTRRVLRELLVDSWP